MAFKVAADLTEFAYSPPGFFDEQEEELPEVIQGKTVRSKLEARVALALVYYKIDFVYQYKFNGGTQIRGGQSIDFLAKTAPLWTPIYVQGQYWHGEEKKYEDTIKVREFNRATRAMFRDPVLLLEQDLYSIEAAKNQVKEKVL